ncbi:MAG: hypothetical protein IAI48_16725 [Candidatus Eremiobacteraeota bacterium]|nr:hypothetical protein [Candidatus Eremiobacteraeota bacterium]
MITLAEIELRTERIRSHGVINDCAFELRRCNAASVSELEILQAELSVTLPDDLFKLLLESNGIVYGYFKGRVPMDVIKISSVAEII